MSTEDISYGKDLSFNPCFGRCPFRTKDSTINHNLEQQCFALYQDIFIESAMPEWETGFLVDLGEVVGGSTPSKAKPEYYTDHGIAWITPKDLSVNKNKFISRGVDDITELGLHNSSTRLMPPWNSTFQFQSTYWLHRYCK
jgi:hypothetical protein